MKSLSTCLESILDDDDVFLVYNPGFFRFRAGHDALVLPSVYLKSSTTITDGLGTKENPYVLGI